MISHNGPYVIGAELFVIVNAPKYCGGNLLSRICVKVRRIFTFTNGQTMKVAIIAQPDGCELPSTAFLKLYDRRFLRDRMTQDATEPWTHEGEVEAEKVWAKLRERARSSVSNDIPVDGSEQCGSDEDDYEEELKTLEEWDESAVRCWEIESEYRRYTRRWFNNECRAYHELQTLQGICVPQLYGTAELEKTCTNPLYRTLEVFGILLEFIEGISLDDLDSGSPLAVKHPHIGQTTVDCFDRIARLGVLHGDIHLGNIVVRQDGRVFLVDFALAIFRGEEVDEDWRERVASESETTFIKIFLDRKSLLDRTPPEPYTCSIHEYAMFNGLVDDARESWRERYYEEASYGSYYDDENGRVCVRCTPRWRLKREAAAQRIIELVSYRNGGFENPTLRASFSTNAQNCPNGYIQGNGNGV
jgi:tRNA A-37 threonylcarbamoyl transferase component Bud32